MVGFYCSNRRKLLLQLAVVVMLRSSISSLAFSSCSRMTQRSKILRSSARTNYFFGTYSSSCRRLWAKQQLHTEEEESRGPKKLPYGQKTPLRNDLKSYRLQQSEAMNKPAYVVFPNSPKP
mmetsp:Transcript_4708/g.7343  ORF Transcript_4708/g.7343 Transcript_4708/m.7343 type:complete len:121 (+) Transcript_4708:11-373(+)